MLDCTCPVEMIEITRLDGGESFWVRADDPVWGTMEPCACPDRAEPTRDTAEAHDDSTDAGAQRTDDDDLYNFGQDRGPEIDDDAESAEPEIAEIDAGAAIDAVTPPREYETVPARAPEIAAEDRDAADEPLVLAPTAQPAPIALLPVAPKISWIGGKAARTSPSLPSLTIEQEAAPEAAPTATMVGSPAPSWTDIAAMPM